MATSLGDAPVGNQNARQHGLYSQKAPLPPAEQIAALREYTANLIAKTASLQSPREIARTLRRLTLAYNALISTYTHLSRRVIVRRCHFRLSTPGSGDIGSFMGGARGCSG